MGWLRQALIQQVDFRPEPPPRAPRLAVLPLVHKAKPGQERQPERSTAKWDEYRRESQYLLQRGDGLVGLSVFRLPYPIEKVKKFSVT